MSKYGDISKSRIKKDEIDDDLQTSLLIDKQYSFSKVQHSGGSHQSIEGKFSSMREVTNKINNTSIVDNQKEKHEEKQEISPIKESQLEEIDGQQQQKKETQIEKREEDIDAKTDILEKNQEKVDSNGKVIQIETILQNDGNEDKNDNVEFKEQLKQMNVDKDYNFISEIQESYHQVNDSEEDENRQALRSNHQKRKSILRMLLKEERENTLENDEYAKNDKPIEFEGNYKLKVAQLNHRKDNIIDSQIGSPKKTQDWQSFPAKFTKIETGERKLEKQFTSSFQKQDSHRKRQEAVNRDHFSIHESESKDKSSPKQDKKNDFFFRESINQEDQKNKAENKNQKNDPKPQNIEKLKQMGNVVKGSEIYEDRSASEKAVEFVKRMYEERKRARKPQQNETSIKLAGDNNYNSSPSLKNYDKREKIYKKLDEMRERSEDRKQLKILSDDVVKQLQTDMKLNSIEERFNKEQELNELERRKKALAEKRRLNKPVRIQEIREHAKKYDEDIKLKQLQSKINIFTDYGDIDTFDKYPRYSAMAKILEEDKNWKMRDQKGKEMMKEQSERKKEYARLVKEVHVPKVRLMSDLIVEEEEDENQNRNVFSNKKRYFLENNRYFQKEDTKIRHIQHSKKAKSTIDLKQDLYSESASTQNQKIPLNLQRNLKQQQSNHQQDNNISNNSSSKMILSPFSPKTNPLPGLQTPIPKNIIDRARITSSKNEGSSNSKQELKNLVEIENSSHHNQIYQNIISKSNASTSGYIKELRLQREELEKKTGKISKLEDWEKYSYDPNLSLKDKFSYVMQSAARLEHNAKLKQLHTKYDISEQQKASNMYIDSIEAKISLLDSLV